MRHVAIVGASLAGVSAAEGLRTRGYQGRITLIDAESRAPYDKPPLSKGALAGDVELHATALRPPEWYVENAVDLRLGTRVTGLDDSARQLRTQAGEAIEYDGLVVATGATARRLRGCCAQPELLHMLRSVDDASRLRGALRPGRHLVVVGGGFIGLEAAATARGLGVEVTVVETAPTLLSRAFPATVGHWFADLHQRNGVRVICGTAVEEITVGRCGYKVRLAEETLSADVVLTGIGAAPAIDWLSGSGVELGNGVRCAPDLSTGVPGVVAAGDVAHWYNEALGESMRVEHWTNAVEQGRHAVGTLLGDREAYRAVPYFWTDQHDAKVRFVGRAAATDDVAIGRPKDGSLIALFGRNGVLRGAACINAARELGTFRAAIDDRVAWHDAVSTLPT
ncbi:NAD(P)/FAD-dependent oxidoreductase [Nonomuraea sp. NPDC049400]|uniref:NAD(P)/FAD-dependent oxidoreductase n=1 Tax=Nonomuraea sp. NPDC049400 TaxID=3364352 RepID=UPI003792BB41